MSLFQLLISFIRRHWVSYALAGMMLAGISTLNVWMPRQIGQVVDGLATRQLAISQMWIEIAWMMAAAVVIYFLRAGWRLQLFTAAFRLGVELRARLYRRLSLQGSKFFQDKRTGNLMALATNDIDGVEMAAGEAMLAGFDGTLTLVIVISMMTLGVDWRLALCALLPFPGLAYGFARVSRKVHAASTDALDRFGLLNNHVQETLSGVRTVRALGLVRRSEQEFSRRATRVADASLQEQRWEAGYEPIVGFTLVSSTTITLGVGGWLIWNGELSVGQLTSFVLYLDLLIWPMFAAGWVLALLQRGKAAWERLSPVLEEPLQINDHGTVDAVKPGDMEWINLGFSYPGQGRPALEGLNFSLTHGQTLGLVGPTGAGKSTLLRLLLRQHEPDTGQIDWGGVRLNDYRLSALRGSLAWVGQEPFLFSASVAENIGLARPGASRAEVEEAARIAAVHDDISRLPNGYDTPVGERGVTLSGGQRQRLALARALLTDAPLLLLDDALSAVDTDTESRILSHLRSARQGRTVIIVTHRLSAVADADQVLVLREGHVVESGRPADLAAGQGWYARQWRYQQLEASIDAA